MKRGKLTGWELALFATPLISLGVMACLSDEPIGWRFARFQPRQMARKSSCLNNLKQLGLAMVQYAKDYDDKFPPATIGGARPAAPAAAWSLKPPVGWVDALYLYTHSSTLNYCPGSSAKYGSPISPNATHFFLNGNLSAFPRPKVKRPAATLLIGDGNDGREVANGAYSKTALPPQWLSDYDAPCYRHLGRANYLFADGHGTSLRPRDVSTAPGAAYTFSVQ